MAVVYQSLTEILKIGISQGWLTPAILYGSDIETMEIIKKNNSRLPAVHLKIFQEKFSVIENIDLKSADFIHVKKKIRLFDPPVLAAGRARPLSELSREFKDTLCHYKELFEERVNGKGYKIVFQLF